MKQSRKEGAPGKPGERPQRENNIANKPYIMTNFGKTLENGKMLVFGNFQPILAILCSFRAQSMQMLANRYITIASL